MKKLIKSAFTLIELLVVIAIIGILSGLIVVAMNSSINSANDAKRKAGIDTIRKALVIYGTLNGKVYPIESSVCNIGPVGTTNRCTTLASALSELLPNVPVDPVSGYYTYVSNGTDFTVSIILSNSSFYNYSPSIGFSGTQVFISGSTNWTVPAKCETADVLVVAGGGGGGGNCTSCGGAGGGGAGGLIYRSAYDLTPRQVIPITVGAGGAGGASKGATTGTNGSNSIFNDLIAVGGGGGKGQTGTAGSSGGSGGGGGGGGNPPPGAGGSGTAGQGNSGGAGISTPYGGGGGGGAGGAGNIGYSTGNGNGGVGLEYFITGASVYYAGGGGGGAYSTNPVGAGGLGGGGAGANLTTNGGNGFSGTPNTGGGGGGANGSSIGGAGGAGGSGIVIVRCNNI